MSDPRHSNPWPGTWQGRGTRTRALHRVRVISSSFSSLPLALGFCFFGGFFVVVVGFGFLWGSFVFLFLHPKQLFHFLLETWALNKRSSTCTYRYRGCTVVIRYQCASTGNAGCQGSVQLMNKPCRSGNYQLEFASITQNTFPVFAEMNSVHQGRAELQCSSRPVPKIAEPAPNPSFPRAD